jgi:hypothetical protein
MYSSWMRWTDGPDAANALFHAVNDCHLKKQPIVFTTNKSPLTAWGSVLHDHDLGEAVFDRILERGRLLVLDGPSYRMRHLPALDLPDSNDDHATKPDRISGKKPDKISGSRKSQRTRVACRQSPSTRRFTEASSAGPGSERRPR